MRNRNNGAIRKIVFIILDVLAILTSSVFAYVIAAPHLDFQWHVALWFAVNLVFTILVFIIMGMYSMVYESIGVLDLLKMLFAMLIVFLGNVVYVTVVNRFMKDHFPDFEKDVLTMGTAITYATFEFSARHFEVAGSGGTGGDYDGVVFIEH